MRCFGLSGMVEFVGRDLFRYAHSSPITVNPKCKSGDYRTGCILTTGKVVMKLRSYDTLGARNFSMKNEEEAFK